MQTRVPDCEHGPAYWIVMGEYEGRWYPVKIVAEVPLWRLEEILDHLENNLSKGWGRLRLERIKGTH